jgi:hypothetical protein
MAQSRVSHPLVDLGFVVRRPFAEANTCVFAIGVARGDHRQQRRAPPDRPGRQADTAHRARRAVAWHPRLRA